MGRYVLGIDVGGTNVKLGLVNPSGRIISRSYLITKTFASAKNRLIDTLAQAILALISQNKLPKKSFKGIGIGLPGLIDPYRGIVQFLPNIPGWRNVPLKKILEKKLNVPVLIDNDAKMITLGEWKFGAGKGVDNLLCMTLGTGVGSGLILNGQLYRGVSNTAGEFGHVPLNEKGPRCNCGGIACFEGYVGNERLVHRARTIFKKDVRTVQDLGRLAKGHDQEALRFWEETGKKIAQGLITIINLLNLERIVIGGGVANNLPHMIRTIQRTISARALKVPAARVEIVRARLGDDAGILGTYVLVNDDKTIR